MSVTEASIYKQLQWENVWANEEMRIAESVGNQSVLRMLQFKILYYAISGTNGRTYVFIYFKKSEIYLSIYMYIFI